MIVRSPYPDVDIPASTVTDFVTARFAEYGDKPALIDGPSGRVLTYAELARQIDATAASLAQRGFKKGDVFAIFSSNLPEYAVAFHGIARAGGVITTANPLYTARELADQLADAGARYIVTAPAFLDTVREAARANGIENVFVFGEGDGATPFSELSQGTAAAPEVAINPAEDLVVLPYSSGTTGLPKGVMLTHRNLVANLAQLAGIKDTEMIGHDDSVLGVLPFFHIYGMVVIMNYALMVGSTVVTMPRFDLEQFLSLIQQHAITRLYLVPPIVVALGKHPAVEGYDLSSLRSIFCGAAPLGEEQARDVEMRLDCDVLQGYGLTETSPVTHAAPSYSPLKASIGPPLPNTEVKVADVESGEMLAAGQHGELCIRGPQVMRGYLNNPEATAETIDGDGWLQTGDLGYFDERGYFYIVDRVKELIKYNAYQVAPAELEALLLSHSDVADAAVIPVPDEECGQIPKAYIVSRGDVSGDDLMAWVAERVAPQKRIRLVEFTDVIPKSASGKILRRQLIERENARAEALEVV